MGNLIGYDDFSKGLNDTTPPDKLHDSELMEAFNIDLCDRGGFSTRKGVTKLNNYSYDAEITQCFEWICSKETRLLAMIDKKLYLINPTGPKTEKITLKSDRIGYFFYQHRLYFCDGDEFYSWGEYDYPATGTSVSIKSDDIVFNKPKSSGGGVEGAFYKAKKDMSAKNLSTADYTVDTDWEEVTGINGIISNVIRLVKPQTKDKTGAEIKDNDLKPIKKCKYFVLHQKSLRIFAAGNPDNPTALYFSEPGSIGYFKGTNVVFPANSEGEVTAITPLLSDILVSYNNSWWHWRGIDPLVDATWEQLPIPYGAISNDAVVLTPFSITFLGRNGIYKLHASGINSDIVMIQNKEIIDNLAENRIEQLIKGITNIKNACAVFHDNKYMLAYCDEGETNNKVLVYDFGIGGFAVYKGWQVNDWCPKASGDLFFASKNFILKQDDVYTDIDLETGEQKPINLRVKTKYYNLGLGLNAKLLKRFFLMFKQTIGVTSTIDITIKCDYQKIEMLGINLEDTLVYGRTWGNTWGYTDFSQKYIIINEISPRFQVLLENNNLNDPITVYGLGFDMKPLRAPKGEMIEKEGWLLE